MADLWVNLKETFPKFLELVHIFNTTAELGNAFVFPLRFLF